MESTQSENRRGWAQKRSTFRYWILGLVIAAVAGGIFAWPHAVQRYHQWNSQRHVRAASESLAKGDFRHAALSAQSALAHNPADAQAVRVMAQSLEALGAPEAVQWRDRLDTLLPGDAENVLARARTALKTNGVEAAEQMVNSLSPEARSSAAYHDVAAAIALEKRDAASAESHWAEASRLEPDKIRHHVNLARVRLESRTPGTRAAALDVLQELRAKPSASLEVLRLLLADAFSNHDANRVREMADALVADARSSFDDKLTRLTALRKIQDPRSGPYLLELRDEAVSEPANLYALLGWMNSHDLALMVTEWVGFLPPELASKPPICIAMAEAYSKVGAWRKLEELTGSTKWGGLDYIRRAFLSRALDRLGEEEDATREWTEAVAAARARSDAMERLAKIALGWKWDRRAEEIMWALAGRPECPRWVADSLWNTVSGRGETAQLQKLSAVLAKLDPKGVATRNNYAFLSLLTRTDEGNPHRVAESLHREHPENGSVAATYGLSLYQRGKAKEAVALMSTLKPEDLREPQVALYYAIFLIAAGHADRADEYLKLSAGSPMLPEEKALLARAKAANLEAQESYRKPTAPAAPPDTKP
jgi:predicted Zn-dependent protease